MDRKIAKNAGLFTGVLSFWFFITCNGAFGAGMFVEGLGTRTLGMGAVNVATVNNSNALSYNPGAMGLLKGGVFDFDLGLVYPQLHFQNSLNDEDARERLFPMPSVGFVTKVMNEKFAFGVAIHPVAGSGAEYDLIHPLYGDEPYETEGFGIKFPVGVAYRIHDRLAVGVSFGLFYQNFTAGMPFTANTGPMIGASAATDIEVDGAGFFGNLGVIYQLNDRITLGAVYKSRTTGGASGDAKVNMDAQLAVMGLYPGIITNPTSKYDADVDLQWPQSIGVGISWKCSERLLLAAEVEWINWSDTMDFIPIKYSNGSNPEINALGGSAFNHGYPGKWDDQFVIRLGGEYALKESLKLRAGVIYGESPVPDESLLPIGAAITEWIGTLGMGYMLSDVWEVNVAYMHAFENKQRTRISILSQELNNSSVEVSADSLYFGLTYRFGGS